MAATARVRLVRQPVPLTVTPDAVSFLLLGDWGRGGSHGHDGQSPDGDVRYRTVLRR